MLHPRNRHSGRYDFPKLIAACPELGEYVILNPYGKQSIDFANPDAVRVFNRALLRQFYGIQHWDIPAGYLCPPVPGRADYLHGLADLLAGDTGPRGKNFNMRWIASMVADVHRILTRGGIFIYPWDRKDPGKAGKLRLMYEANPMAMIIEQAGGAATDGSQRILDIQPTSLHQRVPVFLGSKEEVLRITAYHRS